MTGTDLTRCSDELTSCSEMLAALGPGTIVDGPMLARVVHAISAAVVCLRPERVNPYAARLDRSPPQRADDLLEGVLLMLGLVNQADAAVS